jgi:hypothetical protein
MFYYTIAYLEVSTMSEEVVLNRFYKLRELVGEVMATIVMWDDLPQKAKDSFTVSALFMVYRSAVPDLKVLISEEILKRENISFEELRSMRSNIFGDDRFEAELMRRMELLAANFNEYKELHQIDPQRFSSEIFKAASTIKQLLYILGRVKERADDAYDKIVARIESGDIKPSEVVDICRHVCNGDIRKEKLVDFIEKIPWPFEKWRQCLCEVYSYESKLAVFFLEKMYNTAETWNECWLVREKCGNYSMGSCRMNETKWLISKAEFFDNFNNLFGEILSSEEQRSIIKKIYKRRIDFSFEELSLLRELCRRRHNNLLAAFTEELMSEKASSFDDWKAILNSYGTIIAKPYVIQMLSQRAASAEEWYYVYDISCRYNCSAMANKALRELKTISALI